MAEVTGSIGNEPVELNNAATEATLKLLLQATLSANRQTLDSVRSIAQSSGLNAETVAAANENLNRLASGSTKLGAAYGALTTVSESLTKGLSKVADVTKEITSGTGNVSGVFDVFSKLPGVLGTVFSGMQKLAAYQESLLQTYQSITRVGANFGGSLTQMRQAAADTFMTLDEFRDVISANGETFAKMGLTVNQGATSFRQLSKELLGSELGRDLRALGMSSKEVNEGMLNYISATGGRTKKELENTDSITKATSEYLTELDKLTQFSGRSRKEQEEDQKKAAMNAAYQRALSRMTEEQKARAEIGRQAAANSGIAGAQEAFMARVAKLPPVTADAARFTAVYGQAAQGVNRMADEALSVTGTMKGVNDGLGMFNEGVVQGTNNLGITGDALAFTGDKVVNSTSLYAIQLEKSGRDTAAGTAKAQAEATAEQAKRKQSEAAQAVATQQAMQELGQELLTKLLPIVSSLWNVMNPLVTTVSKVLTAMLKVPYLFEILGASLAAAILALAVVKTRAAVAAVGGMFGGGGRGTLGSAGNPIHVIGGGIPGAGRGPGIGGAAGRAAGSAGGALGGLGAGIGSGVGAALTGLSTGLMSLANPRAMLGTVTLGLLSGSLLISAKAFKEFTGVSWKDVGIATLAITGLAAGAAALSFIAPAILIGSAALGALGGAIWLLAKGLTEFPTDVFPSLNLSFGALGDIVSDVFGTINSVVSGMWTAIKSTFGLVWDAISWPFKQLGSLVSGTFDVVSTLVTGLYDGIKSTFGSIWDVISYPFKQVGSVVTTSFDAVTGLVTGLYNGIKSTFGFVWDVISYPFNQLGSVVTTSFETVKGIFSGLFSNVSSVFSGITSSIKAVGEFISNTFKWAIDKVTNFLGLIKGAISAVASLFGLGENTLKNQTVSVTESTSSASALLQAAKTLQSAGDKLLAFNLSFSSVKGSSFTPTTAATSISAMRPSLPGIPPAQLDRLFSPVTTKAALTGFASSYNEKQMQLPPITEQSRREVIESNTSPSRVTPVTIETLNTQLITLNKLSEEMVKYFKESIEYARRNVDATRSLNPNLLKR
jgi:phage-related protein